MMSTVHRREGGYRVISKGAPDVLIARCTHQLRGSGTVPLSGAAKAKLLGEISRLAEKALRVLAVAYKDVEQLPTGSGSGKDRKLESGLVFCGLIGMEDPPRKGVRTAVLECRRAGL